MILENKVIDELKYAKYQLAEAIKKQIQDFERDANVQVANIYFTREVMQLSNGETATINLDVDVKIKISDL